MCQHSVASMTEQDVRTIEGVEDHPVQPAWLEGPVNPFVRIDAESGRPRHLIRCANFSSRTSPLSG